MKRMLSWLTLLICCTVFYYAQIIIWSLLFEISGVLYGYSEVAFWIIAVLGGSTAVWLLVVLFVYAVKYTVWFSERVYKSRTKARYYITGGLIAFSGFAWLILYFAGLVEAGDKIFFFLVELTLLAYGIGIIVWPKGEQGDLEASSSKKSSDAVERYIETHGEDKEYINNLIQDFPELNYIDGSQFYRVIVEYKLNGKEAALKRFDRYEKILERENPGHGMYAVPYLAGALAANKIITNEESVELGQKYIKVLFDAYIREANNGQIPSKPMGMYFGHTYNQESGTTDFFFCFPENSTAGGTLSFYLFENMSKDEKAPYKLITKCIAPYNINNGILALKIEKEVQFDPIKKAEVKKDLKEKPEDMTFDIRMSENKLYLGALELNSVSKFQGKREYIDVLDSLQKLNEF